jgi:crotonobetainyl-CoA:carnitine CoA-transferase CaiB-like acyl-CoA transferase
MVTRELPAPLAGLKVVEIGVAMAGPYCAMMLADYGADVIKVERTEQGDESRNWAPFFEGRMSHYFAAVNRNKRSLAVNLKSSEGRDIVEKLALEADVLIDNFRPGVLENLGLGYESLHAKNPRLIYCSITGYGATGPLKDERANDVAMQAYAGGMSITGEAGRGPVKMGISVADIGAGMFAAHGVLMALHVRDATGKGQRVDTSLLEGQIAMLSYHYTAYFASGKPPERKGSSAQGLVPYQAFEASDGWMVVAVFTDRMWRDLCNAVGKPDWGDDARFNTPQQRMTNRDTIIAALSGMFAREPVAAWRERLTPLGIPCTPVQRIDQVAEQEQVSAREMIVEVEASGSGVLRLPGVPIKFSDAAGGVRTGPPQLGEHTREIVGTLGYSDADLRRLEAAGVVASK